MYNFRSVLSAIENVLPHIIITYSACFNNFTAWPRKYEANRSQYGQIQQFCQLANTSEMMATYSEYFGNDVRSCDVWTNTQLNFEDKLELKNIKILK